MHFGLDRQRALWFLGSMAKTFKSWDVDQVVLLDLKRRGLTVDPRLAIGDGALGFWRALRSTHGRVHRLHNPLSNDRAACSPQHAGAGRS